MNRFIKQIIAVALVGAMALPTVACSKDESSNKLETSNVSTDSNGMINFDLTLTPNPTLQPEQTTAPVVTTTVDANGDIFVNKTDINGTTVTEDGGKPVTEVYTGTTLATSYAEPNYQPKEQNYQALWLDMSKQADFVFDGQFLVFNAKIADNAPDGIYPINIFHTDFANYAAKSLNVTSNVGYVCVNATAPKTEKTIGDSLTVSANTVSGKPGETVQIVFELDNNPGFVGFNFMFSYDGNAISIVDGGAGKDFATRANLTAHEIK